jgi:hypothetical protein
MYGAKEIVNFPSDGGNERMCETKYKKALTKCLLR